MTVFWMLVATMTVIALLFVIPPLFRSRRALQIDRDQLNTEVIKDQLRELRADLETGKLDREAYAAARRDLERELLDDLDVDQQQQQVSQRSGRWVAGVLGALIPALAVSAYHLLGTKDIVPLLAGEATVQAGASDTAGQPTLEEMVAKLDERMRAEPDNVEGWVMLGRSYAAMNRFSESAEAFAQANRLAAGDPQIMTDYADVLVMASGGEFTDEVGALLDKALEQQPANVKALWLRGHWKVRHEDYSGAISDWQQAAAQLPPGHANIALINEQIQQAQQQLTGSGVAAAAQKPAAGEAAQSVAKAAIQVTVALDPGLQDRVAADDTLFIFARAVSGPKMPLAIMRKQARDLPVTVTLDDSQSMSPAMVLSAFEQVTVGARISRTGQAMPASGDLQGSLSPVSTHGDQQVQLTIDQVVP
jgi:cytochrome c-type biogenesis protein CcmH